jgi:hypothetical protein
MTLDAMTLLAQAAKQAAEKTTTVADLPATYLEAAILLAAIAAAASVMVFFRQKRIAQNQVDTARLVEELLERKK